MSRSKSQHKDIFMFNRSVTQNQPFSEVNKGIQKQRKQVGLKKVDQGRRKDHEVTPKKVEFASLSKSLRLGFSQQKIEEIKPTFKFQLQCINDLCSKDDVLSLISYGGYSIKSKIEKANQMPHNHRKVNKQTVYEYTEDELPLIRYLEEKFDEKINTNNQISIEQKEKPQSSPFEYLFCNKKENLYQRERQIANDEKRQKQQIQKYNKYLQRKKEDQQKRYAKSKTMYATKHPMKQIVKSEDDRIMKSSHNQNIEEKRDEQSKNNGSNIDKKDKMKTRLQQKQDISEYQIYKQAEPVHANRFCYPCRQKFENYKLHIDSSIHKLKIQKALGNEYFMEQVYHFEELKKQEINSREYKNLQKLAIYLQQIIDSTEELIMKKHKQFKMHAKKMQEQIQRCFH